MFLFEVDAKKTIGSEETSKILSKKWKKDQWFFSRFYPMYTDTDSIALEIKKDATLPEFL